MGILISGTTNDITINGVSVATDAEVSSAVAPKANTADLKEIGVGQTWQDVTASRVVGTTYTNTTGKPIFISVYTAWTSSNTLTLTIGGVATQLDGVDQGFTYPKVVAIIPNNITYSVSGWAAGKWFELR